MLFGLSTVKQLVRITALLVVLPGAKSQGDHRQGADLRLAQKQSGSKTINTGDDQGNAYRSTRAIASWTNLTEDRVRYICSIDDRIFLSTGEREDLWSLYEKRSRGG